MVAAASQTQESETTVAVPRRPADYVVAVTFDEIEEALGSAAVRLRSAKKQGKTTALILQVIDSLLDWRILITSVWLDYARRGNACTSP